MPFLRSFLSVVSLVLTGTVVARAQSTVASAHSSAPSEPNHIVYAGAAEEAPTIPDPNLPTVTEWYGLTTLAVDGAAMAVAGVGLALTNNVKGAGVLAATGLCAFALGAPVVHIAKGEYWSALGSLALRVGLMLPAVAVGSVAPKNSATATLLGSAAVLAAGIDAAGLAYRQVPVTPSAQAWLTYLPVVSVGRDSATLLFSGQF
jgi:hypothetical protein